MQNLVKSNAAMARCAEAELATAEDFDTINVDTPPQSHLPSPTNPTDPRHLQPSGAQHGLLNQFASVFNHAKNVHFQDRQEIISTGIECLRESNELQCESLTIQHEQLAATCRG